MVSSKTKLNLLEQEYFNPERPAAYSGARNLISALRKRVPRAKIIDWLEKQDAYTKHKPVRRKYPRRTYNVHCKDDLWEGDLIDFRNLKSFNKGFSYLLVVIDCLSKYLWIEPLRDKSGTSVAEKFQKILQESNRTPTIFQTDRGREFLCHQMQSVLKNFDIIFRTSRSPDVKAANAERVIRSIKERIWRYLTHRKSKTYINVLQKIVFAYNHTRHTGTRLLPAEVNSDNESIAYRNLQERYTTKKKSRSDKYKVGDYVRVSKAKAVFGKSYKPGFTDEIFAIKRKSHAREPVVYILQDLNGEEIDGIFYTQELSRVNPEFVKAS